MPAGEGRGTRSGRRFRGVAVEGFGRGNSRLQPFVVLKSENGAEGQNRTADTMIFSHVLYRLSYLGTQETECCAIPVSGLRNFAVAGCIVRNAPSR